MGHKEFVFAGYMVTKKFYLEVLCRFLKQSARVRPEAQKKSEFQFPPQQCTSLHHNNSAAIFDKKKKKKKKKKKGFQCLATLCLSPSDYFVFPKMKMELNSDQYRNISEIQKSVIVKLKSIPIHKWEKTMKWLKDCAKECIHTNRNYFE